MKDDEFLSSTAIGRWRVLEVLCDGEPHEWKELRAETGLNPQRLSRILRIMVEEGSITKRLERPFPPKTTYQVTPEYYETAKEYVNLCRSCFSDYWRLMKKHEIVRKNEPKINEDIITFILEHTIIPYVRDLKNEVKAFKTVFPSDKWFHVKNGKSIDTYWSIGIIVTEKKDLVEDFFEDFKNWTKQRANAKVYHEKRDRSKVS